MDEKWKLPCVNPTLYLQIDNCGENKNKTLIAFLTDLVRKKVFHKIKACFLMVGHTHDDIDQVFATISGKFMWYALTEKVFLELLKMRSSKLRRSLYS